ncbi:hypothetical protein LU293_00245 [Moraxella nasovis]|uniref:hypothetical protein n=1 Tax=Moraxella nasovis TaxID=2904121 RepID=UPI001F61ADDE|nr:hypothetical protein [Moraxella nasovis]UNU73383.1 hypothetical protein LU293_00245 [Moraxella nasovis]
MVDSLNEFKNGDERADIFGDLLFDIKDRKKQEYLDKYQDKYDLIQKNIEFANWIALGKKGEGIQGIDYQYVQDNGYVKHEDVKKITNTILKHNLYESNRSIEDPEQKLTFLDDLRDEFKREVAKNPLINDFKQHGKHWLEASHTNHINSFIICDSNGKLHISEKGIKWEDFNHFRGFGFADQNEDKQEADKFYKNLEVYIRDNQESGIRLAHFMEDYGYGFEDDSLAGVMEEAIRQGEGRNMLEVPMSFSKTFNKEKNIEQQANMREYDNKAEQSLQGDERDAIADKDLGVANNPLTDHISERKNELYEKLNNKRQGEGSVYLMSPAPKTRPIMQGEHKEKKEVLPLGVYLLYGVGHLVKKAASKLGQKSSKKENLSAKLSTKAYQDISKNQDVEGLANIRESVDVSQSQDMVKDEVTHKLFGADIGEHSRVNRVTVHNCNIEDVDALYQFSYKPKHAVEVDSVNENGMINAVAAEIDERSNIAENVLEGSANELVTQDELDKLNKRKGSLEDGINDLKVKSEEKSSLLDKIGGSSLASFLSKILAKVTGRKNDDGPSMDM